MIVVGGRGGGYHHEQKDVKSGPLPNSLGGMGVQRRIRRKLKANKDADIGRRLFRLVGATTPHL